MKNQVVTTLFSFLLLTSFLIPNTALATPGAGMGGSNTVQQGVAELETKQTQDELEQKQLEEQRLKADQEARDILEKKVINPILQIPIPGFNPEETVFMGNGDNGCNSDEICITTISTYINKLYIWSISAALMITIVLMMAGGIQYMVGSAVGTIESAKTRMKNAAIGLVLLLSTTAILSFINPNIVSFKPVGIKVIERADDISLETVFGASTPTALKDLIMLESEMTQEQKNAGMKGLTSNFKTEHLRSNSGVVIHPDIIIPLQEMAEKLFAATGSNARIASGGRPQRKQAALFLSNYHTSTLGSYKKGKIPTCNPFPRTASESPFIANSQRSGPWKVKKDILKQYPTESELNLYLFEVAQNNKNISCPHSPGLAVDIWCEDAGNHTDSVTCHMALEDAMKAAGFKRLTSETWHFEFNSNGHTPISPGAKGNTKTGFIYKDSKVYDYSQCANTTGWANMAKMCCSDKGGTCVK